MNKPPQQRTNNKWILLAIIVGLFAVIVPVAFKFGQTIARDGMDKALEEKAIMDAELAANLTARDPVGVRNWQATRPGGIIVWYELGEGTPVVMFASAGREASDFNELANAIAGAGYKAVMVEAPGINGAVATETENPTMFTLAEDAHIVVKAQSQPVFVLGHAFGNRLARAVATKYPDDVRGVILVASGGQKPIEEKARKALLDSFDTSLPLSERREQVHYGFFSDGNEIPDYWLRGWHQDTANIHAKVAFTHNDEWRAGGSGPMLVIAAMQDTIAPPEDTIDLLEAEFGDRVTAIRIENAGHALLPEQPDIIHKSVINWLSAHE